MTSLCSVFRDESKLDINYIPAELPHREREQRLLEEFFSFILQCPGRMTQRVILVGDVGTGKTALAQSFGADLTSQTKRKNLKFHYIHINCREFRGSLQPILHKIVTAFRSNYPARGYAADEILSTLMQVLDEEETTLIVTLDEFDSLIEKEGSDAVYKLTRIHETRQGKPQRLSFIFIMRDLKATEQLDDSTKSTLQRNIIRLERYGKPQLIDILNARVALAFRLGAVEEDVVDLVAELAYLETGNARFGIELLWRAGKYADASEFSHVRAECIRSAVSAILPTLRRSDLASLGFHEKLFLLAIARYFKENQEAYVQIGEAEKAYKVICEEYDESPKSHTQIWTYVQYLSKLGILKAEVVAAETRGRTNRLSLPSIPAFELEQEMQFSLQKEKGEP
ncbi:MAG: ORC1-type DNA replication protein [Nitrososphaerota archaeon]|jgi:cell division control protein 6|nr:ORC1-type DNA replication protein [Nitrososphaerota archaeon]